MRFDDPASERLDPEPTEVQGAANHETRLWPRPQACTHRPKKMIDLQERLLNPRQTKLVNAKRGLEFRPVLKVGSTLMRHLLPCLQPGEWEDVPQNTSVRKGSTVLVLRRDPISKFAAALGEVMARTSNPTPAPAPTPYPLAMTLPLTPTPDPTPNPNPNPYF